MKKRLSLPLGLALAASLLLPTAPASAKSSRGGHGGATSGTTSTGGRGAAASGMKSGPAPVGGVGLRQPCDRKGVSRFEGGGVRGFSGGRGFGLLEGDQESFLIVDATPGDAQVFLDGRRLGTAGQLVAHALPLSPGRHAVVIVARGFQPYVARFAADPTFPVRLRVALALE